MSLFCFVSYFVFCDMFFCWMLSPAQVCLNVSLIFIPSISVIFLIITANHYWTSLVIATFIANLLFLSTISGWEIHQLILYCITFRINFWKSVDKWICLFCKSPNWTGLWLHSRPEWLPGVGLVSCVQHSTSRPGSCNLSCFQLRGRQLSFFLFSNKALFPWLQAQGQVKPLLWCITSLHEVFCTP